MLGLTESPAARWHVIPSADDDFRAVATGDVVLSALRQGPALSAKDTSTEFPPVPRSGSSGSRRLAEIDYTLKLNEAEYEERLNRSRNQLGRLVRSPAFRKLPVTLVFEGHDAAGKGSTIRRITHALDARQFRVVQISAPSDQERAYPYLWRFWQQLPATGELTIFDRSWYGRVLVERVEKFAKPAQWSRAYQEINQFEQQLTDSGMLVLKFWLAITKDEQLKRFRAREVSPFKSFKITPEDWRNRAKWAAYKVAANDMFERTDTPYAPWHVIPANDKRYARIAVLETLVGALDTRLKS